jgi:anaerobic magnesium-protoporphyrin IX monomethyl ester cyclase
MNILLLNPNSWGRAFTPIGLATVSGLLKDRGHSTKLFDTTFYDDWEVNEQAEGEKYLSYKFTDLSEYGVKTKKSDQVEDLKKLVAEYRPSLIIFSILSSHLQGEGEYNMYHYGKELLKKAEVKGIPVLVGGIFPSVKPDEVLDDGVVNMVCRGECEEAIAELVDKMERGEDITTIKNLWVKKGNKIFRNEVRPLNPNLDHLPYMDLSIFDDKNFYRPFVGKVYRAIDAELSRGCYYRCDYCVETAVQDLYGYEEANSGIVVKDKGYHREKSIARILSEFKLLKEKFNLEFIRFQDTKFLSMQYEKLKELSEKYPIEVGLPFYIETRPEDLTEKNTKLLKAMGCVGVGMGLEEGSRSFRKDMLNRPCADKVIIEACKNLRNMGIRATTYNVIGFPDETRENIMETIELNRKARPSSMTVAFYSPYVGTPMYELSLDKGIIPENVSCLDQKLFAKVKLDYISSEELKGLRDTFVMYVLSPKILWPLIRLAEKQDLTGKLIYRALRFFLKP